MQFDGLCFPVTASVGMAGVTDDIRTTRAIINAADEALYRAKENGRNQVSNHISAVI